jgi:hypothetical protein
MKRLLLKRSIIPRTNIALSLRTRQRSSLWDSTACRFRFPPHEKTGIWVRAGRYCDLEGPARSALRCKFCQLKAELVQGAQLLLPAKSQFPQAMSAQETVEARQPRPPADFLVAETDSDRLASRPQFNKFLGHCLVSRVARVI